MNSVDLTFFTYIAIRVVLAYCFLLFAVWFFIVKKDGGKVSSAYAIIMCLFIARFYGISLAAFIRSMRLGDQVVYQEWLDGFLWDSRVVPEAVLFVTLAVILTKRFVMSYLFRKQGYRKDRGRRLFDKK